MDHPPLPTQPGTPFLRVALLLCADFTLTPMASFVDALRLAADRRDDSRQIGFQWDFIAATDQPLRSSCGLPVVATAGPERLEDHDCIVVCGGLLRSLPALRPDIPDALRRAAARGATLVGLCTGSFVLAGAGLLDGRRCAAHFHTLADFLLRFPGVEAVSDENFIIDGPVITCPGSIVAIEVAAHLIATHSDRARAWKARNFLLFRPEETRIALKARPYEDSLRSAAPLTQEAVRRMETRLDAPCPIDALAAELNCTRARLTRAFRQDLGQPPAEFWRMIRLHAASEMLQGQRRSITEIAYDLGFADAAHFCTAFRKHYGRSPGSYQRQCTR